MRNVRTLDFRPKPTDSGAGPDQTQRATAGAQPAESDQHISLVILGEPVAKSWYQGWEPDIGHDGIRVNLHLAIDPLGKGRARFSRDGHAYTPAQTREYEESIRWLLKSVVGPHADSESKFGVRVAFSKTDRRRIDVDNLVKALFDAANGIVWRDDAQVRELSARLKLDAPKAGIDLLVYLLSDDPETGSKCEHCGSIMERKPPSQRDARFCSATCASNSKRQEVTCGECGKTFTLPRSLAKGKGRRVARRFCGVSCRNTWWWRHQPKEVQQSTCVDCGKKVSRREYRRCQSCSLIKRRQEASLISKSIDAFVKVV